MSAEIIELSSRRPPINPGSNGGREAMARALAEVMPLGDCLTDHVLAHLWVLGFKLVPVGDEE